MRRHPFTAGLVAVLLGTVAIGATACAGSAGITQDIDMNAATTTTSPGPGAVAVPVAVATDATGAMRAIVHIRVGGGPSVPVLLDTGSAGLRILPGDVGRSVQQTGQTETATFGGGVQLTSQVVQANISIGGLTTPSTTEVSVIQSSGCAPGFPSCVSGKGTSAIFGSSGVVGILGVAMSDATAATVTPTLPYSPLLQLRAPYRNGFTLSLPAGGPDTLVLGTPRATANTVSVPMLPATPSVYPNGVPAWEKDVDLCWTVGTGRGCGTTDLDTGAPETVVTPGAVTGVLGTGVVDQGVPVSVALPDGATVWSYTTNDTAGDGLTLLGALPGITKFNTGIGFFTTHVVGYDAKGGHILITAG
jgi:hypothetical protein